jgi:hypothetical protein
VTIKLNGSTAGSVALDAPASTTGNADIAFKLPTSDGTAGQVLQTDGSGNLSWVTPATTNGITMADSWMIDSNTNISGGETDITSNWKRQVTGQSVIGVIGSAMTESSGIFTFPTTGMYLITTSFSGSNAGNYFGVKIQATADSGSNYSSIGLSYTSTSSSSQYYEVTAQAIFDVTNVSTHKVKFRYESAAAGTINGHSADKRSGVTFIRIGDT